MGFVEDMEVGLTRVGAKLKPVRSDLVEALGRRFNGVPESYVRFLERCGYGMVGGSLHLYGGLVEPDEIYDPETAAVLSGILLFGDDAMGRCFGFDVIGSWRVVGVEPTNSEVVPVAPSFEVFLSDVLARL